MRVLLALFLCLLLAMPAAAAPTREMSGEALENEALIAQVQPLVDAVAAAGFRLNMTSLPRGMAPRADLAQGVLMQALRGHLLVAPANEGQIDLRLDEATALLASLFDQPAPDDLATPAYPGVSALEGSLRFDTAMQEEFIGAHIHDLRLDENELLLYADIYRLSGIVATALEAPEEALTWLGHIGLRLLPSPEAATGFVLASFSIPERYRQTGFTHHVAGKRFELQCPAFLSIPVEDEAALLHLRDEAGDTTLRVYEARGVSSLEDLLSAWWGAEGTGGLPAGYVEEDRAMFWSNQGTFRLAYQDITAGADVYLVLELNYPILSEHEFTLYQTFLINSFVVYSHSVG